MQRYIMKRVFYALISLLILSITIFCLIRLTGDPAVLMVEPGASDAYLQTIRKEFGLDKPWPVQYGVFIINMIRGDFGTSIYYREPAFDLYMQRLPASLLLTAVAMSISLLIGIPIGIF